MHSIAAVEKGCQKSNALRKQVAFFTEKLDQGDF
jgi:hypothetical protein